MPLVRCPDCYRDISVSQDDLTRVIECSVCEARFGPLVAAPAGGAAAPPPAAAAAPAVPQRAARRRTEPARPAPERPAPAKHDDDTVDADPSEPSRRGKRVRPKSGIRFVPILVGVFLAMVVTAAIVGAIYIVIRSQFPQANPPPPAPAPVQVAPAPEPPAPPVGAPRRR